MHQSIVISVMEIIHLVNGTNHSIKYSRCGMRNNSMRMWIIIVFIRLEWHFDAIDASVEQIKIEIHICKWMDLLKQIVCVIHFKFISSSLFTVSGCDIDMMTTIMQNYWFDFVRSLCMDSDRICIRIRRHVSSILRCTTTRKTQF